MREAQGESVEFLLFPIKDALEYIWAKIQLSPFFFQVGASMELILLGYYQNETITVSPG